MPFWALIVHAVLGLAFLGALLSSAFGHINPVTGTLTGFVIIVAGAVFHIVEFQRRNW